MPDQRAGTRRCELAVLVLADVPLERQVSEMKGKGCTKSEVSSAPPVSGLAQRLGPLHRIVEVLRHADDAFGTSVVRFKCGHAAHTSSSAIYKARCRMCRPSAALHRFN